MTESENPTGPETAASPEIPSGALPRRRLRLFVKPTFPPIRLQLTGKGKHGIERIRTDFFGGRIFAYCMPDKYPNTIFFNDGRTTGVKGLMKTISHESLHIVLSRLGEREASARLDSRRNPWLATVTRNITERNGLFRMTPYVHDPKVQEAMRRSDMGGERLITSE
jgi:hypothetical protein